MNTAICCYAIALTCLGQTDDAWARSEDSINEPAKCERRLATAMLIDDSISAPAWMNDQMRVFRLPALAQAAAPIVERSGCFTLLDPDPIFANLTGAAQPEVILRARAVSLKAVEPSLGEKADTAVRRYIGSYLGGNDADIPILRSERVSLQVLCTRQRRIVKEFTAELSAESKSAEKNPDLLIAAFGNAYADLQEIIRTSPNLCGE